MQPDLTALFRSLADELDAARTDLEALSGSLCADPDIVTRHVAALQTLDDVGQRQAAAASVLRAGDPLAAVAAIPLDAMRARLCAVPDG